MARIFALVLIAALLPAAQLKKTSAEPQRSTNAKTAATSTKSTTKTAAAKRPSKNLHASRRSRARHAAAPSYQLHPDPERYVQIQQALAERGYFKGQPNGQWGDDSVDALKRFQADQKLDNDGKINAHSLTALGLGPKHDGTSASTVPLSAAADGASPVPPPESSQTAPSAGTESPSPKTPSNELPPQ